MTRGLSGLEAAEVLGFAPKCGAETVRFIPPDRLLASVPRRASLPFPQDGSLPPWAGAIAIHWMALCNGIKSVTVASGNRVFDVARDEELCSRLSEVESAYWERLNQEESR